MGSRLSVVLAILVFWCPSCRCTSDLEAEFGDEPEHVQRMRGALESVEFPVLEEKLLERLEVSREQRRLKLQALHGIDDGFGADYMLWHHYMLGGDCRLVLSVYREVPGRKWLVSDASIECSALDAGRSD